MRSSVTNYSFGKRVYGQDFMSDPFIFTIDTRLINPSGTNGSENPNTFQLPMPTTSSNNRDTVCIIHVSDGRQPIFIHGQVGTNAKSLLTFETPGKYTIEIHGLVTNFSFYPTAGIDKLKIVEILRWSKSVTLTLRCFNGCSNLVINAPNKYKLPVTTSWFFQGIKGFISSLKLLDISGVVDGGNLFASISDSLPDTPNSNWDNLSSVTNLFSNAKFSEVVNQIVINSNTVTSLSQPWNGVIFENTGDIEIICNTPNLTTMFRVFWTGQPKTRCHAGKIDVRNVTNPSNWLLGTFTTNQVDQTLLGWSTLPFMQSGVEWNWNGSKYSNNPNVINAYNKITTEWGVIFNNLTME